MFRSILSVAVPGAQWRELSRKRGKERRRGRRDEEMFESAKEKRETVEEGRRKLWGVKQTMRVKLDGSSPTKVCRSE